MINIWMTKKNIFYAKELSIKKLMLRIVGIMQ